MRTLALVALVALAACGGRTTTGEGSGPTDASQPNATATGTATATGSSTGDCAPVLASNYDQTCNVDSDCVLVGEFAGCPVVGCECETQAVNISVETTYMTALHAALAANPPPFCNCPAGPCGAACVGGMCAAQSCVPSGPAIAPADAGPAPSDADPPADAGARPDSGWCSPAFGPEWAEQADATGATPCTGFCIAVPPPTVPAPAPSVAAYGCTVSADATDASPCPAGMTACGVCGGGVSCIDSGVCFPPECMTAR